MSDNQKLIGLLRAAADALERSAGSAPAAPALERRPATAAAMAGGMRETVGTLKYVDEKTSKSGKPMVAVKLTARQGGRDTEEKYLAFGDVCEKLLELRGKPVKVFLKPWKDTETIVNVVASHGIEAEDIPF
jgi:hypothetical protein